MRRAGNLFDRIVDRDNLRLATWKAMKGHRASPAARAFASRLDDELLAIAEGLRRGDLPLGEAVTFTIFDPKERRITAPCFRERVVHHAIMNLCEPVFDRTLIDDTFACRRGRDRSRRCSGPASSPAATRSSSRSTSGNTSTASGMTD